MRALWLCVLYRARKLDHPRNADGVMSTMECTGVLPKYNEHGKTDEEKGATRYLGVFLSYDGWQVQQEKLYKMAKSFYW